jgi:hypothetical protein
VLGWVALAVLIGAAVYVVVRLVRSWSAARRRYGDGSAPPPGGEPGLRHGDDGGGTS